jgi:hypothetical protein
MSPLAVAPALPLHSAGKYVAGAYIVFVAVILIYVMIMALRLGRTERALVDLNRDIARREEAAGDPTAGDPDRIAPSATPRRDRDPARLTGAGHGPGDSSL